MSTSSLSYWLHSYFHEWLRQQRGCSPHTVHLYRDTWRLFLRFVAAKRKAGVSALKLTDLDADQVRAFLQHCECDRKTSIATRNCRLAAIRSFYRFVADREPMAALQCAALLRIPVKRSTQNEPLHLESNEVGALLRQLEKATSEGQRDHALLALYNAGARIQEALELRPRDLRLTSSAHVKLRGKGRKERICPICPIWPETASLLAGLLKRQPWPEGEPMSINRYGRPLGAAGVRFKLSQCVQAAVKEVPSFDGKRVHPHTFRHTAGGRRDRDQKLVRPCQPGDDESLRPSKCRNQAKRELAPLI